jgi:membrane fusion protein, copper/silver efflux system
MSDPYVSARDSRMNRDLRRMAIVRWVLLVAVVALAAGTWWVYAIRDEPVAEGPARFYCPMHPEIRAAAPGTCPICFMNLEPIPEDRGRGATHDHASHDAGLPEPAEESLAPVMLTLERRHAIGLTTVRAISRELSRELRLPAVVEAPDGAVSEVRVRTEAFVERVAPIETGARVRAGQPLLWVYAPAIARAEEELFAIARMGIGSTSAEGERSPDVGTRMADAARERLRTLGLSARDIDDILARGHAGRVVPVRAPASGIVTGRDVALGAQVMPDRTLFEVTDLSRVWATATLAAEEATNVPVGTRARFLARGGGAVHEVEAVMVEPLVSAETRTVRIRFLARDADGALLPGDIGEVLASLPAEARILVPRDAVIDLGHAHYVFVERAPGLFEPRTVRVGPLLENQRQILDGIEAGETVVARGAFLLDSESRLEAALAPESAGEAP